jgi:hypothetical protein
LFGTTAFGSVSQHTYIYSSSWELVHEAKAILSDSTGSNMVMKQAQSVVTPTSCVIAVNGVDSAAPWLSVGAEKPSAATAVPVGAVTVLLGPDVPDRMRNAPLTESYSTAGCVIVIVSDATVCVLFTV